MSEQRPLPADDATAALRQTGASPLRLGDPRRVGPYVPVALLGSGGMGRVYLARPADDGPGLVAVKVIRPEYAEDPRFRRRFEREAAVHARLRTPHAPRLCGTGFEDELLWMATEYLPGFDLTEAVREDGALAAAAVWRLVAELGRALAHLAAEGIVHRDLKPSNVLLTVRGAHVIDFGISKAADASAITGTGNRVGTPAYMSPEHLREGVSDTASDVFSLAGTLVYAAAGRAPFGDGTGVDVMHRVAFEDPNPEVLAEISAADPALGALLTACLTKEPARRPTPQELIDAAGARAVPADWPQPLGGKVLARQRAYEGLHLLPVADMPGLRTPPVMPPAQVTPPAQPVPPAAVPVSEPEKDAVGDPMATSSVRLSGLAEVFTRVRRRPLPVVLVALAVCAAVAVALVLLRPDAPATATPGAGGLRGIGSAPRGISAGPESPGTTGRTQQDVDGAADLETEGRTGAASSSTAPGTAGDPATPGSGSGSGDDSASAPGASLSPTPSTDSPSTDTDGTPWLTDCTYYNGKGRTGLGDSGSKVEQVQCMLVKRGYSVGGGGVDGEFGTDTESAVRAFQSDRGLDADGVVAHDTWDALRSTE
ncbi:serine/threonine-protein kinase [Streptomyces sp. NPDC047072]|uniref:serine/threonine-protein kinase n=1 Tax=Streptomyces sp. NPDC047072 TaxID=3154809 RepID=UPI0033F41439